MTQQQPQGFTPKKVLKLARRLAQTGELKPAAVHQTLTETVHIQGEEKPKR